MVRRLSCGEELKSLRIEKIISKTRGGGLGGGGGGWGGGGGFLLGSTLGIETLRKKILLLLKFLLIFTVIRLKKRQIRETAKEI